MLLTRKTVLIRYKIFASGNHKKRAGFGRRLPEPALFSDVGGVIEKLCGLFYESWYYNKVYRNFVKKNIKVDIKMTTAEKLAALRRLMTEYRIDIYIIPTADYHQSEYVGDHFKEREFLTGFTGSAGTAVVTALEARLWTDGRYFLQADEQLGDSEFKLMKTGEPGVPSIEEYVQETLPEYGIIGFDGRAVSINTGKRYEEISQKRGGTIVYCYDLINYVWTNRPAMSQKPVFTLDIRYTGETSASKLKRVRMEMKKHGANALLMTGLDDIGWLLNIRGQDVDYFPLLLSYAVISESKVELYADRKKFSEEIFKEFRNNGVSVKPYNDIYSAIKTLDKDCALMIDPGQVNYALFRSIPEDVTIVEAKNPVILMKAVKNRTETDNIRKAHIKDGVAHTRFMYWLKTNIGKILMTEISVSKKLEEFRKAQDHYLWPSFDPISAYKEHAAIIHYSAVPETNAVLHPSGMLLTDTGGHYLEGSTDITRTVALGPVTPEEKDHFTTVAVSMLRLADTKFLYGCTGMNLDCIAREPFWKLNLNFNHGTGHGVGYLGNIHEPPARFHWKYSPSNTQTLEENMVITDEPGLYFAGSHGIRIENELLVQKDVANEYGQFMYFEMLTFVPIDLDLINPELMEPQDKRLLNEYHHAVYEKIAPCLPAEEQKWLKYYTREI